jgi:Tol biopolymer transport system component
MAFAPKIGEVISIAGIAYSIAEHPAAPSVPYGQEGRQATVYKIVSDIEKRALKVFKSRYRVPGLVTVSHRLESFADLPSLQVCHRTVLTPQRHATLLREHPDLVYAVVMPWIDGPTWMEVLLEKGTFTLEQSLSLARSFVETLSAMEQRSVAHCDLSGPNVLLPSLAEHLASNPRSPIELVDVEQLYAPGMDRPATVPAGSMGYAHHSAPNGLWGPDVDRFAGAVLLAEMLGWCDERVRDAAWGESYFDPAEMHRDGERYRIMGRVLTETWGGAVARLLERAWHSDTLADCATFGEWMLTLPDEVPLLSTSFDAPVHIGSLRPQQKSVITNVVSDTDGPGEGRILILMDEAQRLEVDGSLTGALQKYRQALALVPADSSLQQELVLIVHQLHSQLASSDTQSAGPTNTSSYETGPISIPVVAPTTPIPAEEELAALFDDGLAAYKRQEWLRAKELLGEIVRRQPTFVLAGQEARVLLADVERHLVVKPPVRRSRTLALVPAILLILLVFFGGIALLQAQSAATGQAQATATAVAQGTASVVAVQVARTQAAIVAVRSIETSTALVVAQTTSTARSQETATAEVFAVQSATAVALSISQADAAALARSNELATANALSTSQAVAAITAQALSTQQAQTAEQAAIAQATTNALGTSQALRAQATNQAIATLQAPVTAQAATAQAVAQLTSIVVQEAKRQATSQAATAQAVQAQSQQATAQAVQLATAQVAQAQQATAQAQQSATAQAVQAQSQQATAQAVQLATAQAVSQAATAQAIQAQQATATALARSSVRNGRIAFESSREIHVVNADGSQQTRLTNNRGLESMPAWSPDGQRIAFIRLSGERYDKSEIYVINADGSQETFLANNPKPETSLAWAPVGQRIAFESERDGNREIYVVTADSSQQTRLTNNPKPDSSPAWSPDGQRIAFVSERDGNQEIYVMNADGSQQTRLTDNLRADAAPAWAPVGQRIAFESERDGNREIYVMNADGSQQTRLINNPADDWTPVWSPDGQHIAFVSLRDSKGVMNHEIYVMNADGSQQTRLTDNPGPDDWIPAWSPDGRHIAYASQRGGFVNIYVMNADGSQQTRLTDNPGHDQSPVWSPK